MELFPWQTKERIELQSRLIRTILFSFFTILGVIFFEEMRVGNIRYDCARKVEEKQEEIRKLTKEKENLEGALNNRNYELEGLAAKNFYLEYERVKGILKIKRDKDSKQIYRYLIGLEEQVSKYSTNQDSFEMDLAVRYLQEYGSNQQFTDYVKKAFTPKMLNYLETRVKRSDR